jgi:type VI secretion system protein ImpC
MSSEADFVLGVIGDFSGRGGASDPGQRLAGKVFFDVDREAFGALLGRLAPQAELQLPYLEALTFGSLEDFDPDRIAERVPALAKLLEARESVGDPERARALVSEAGAELAPAAGGEGDAVSSEEPPEQRDAAPPPTESGAGVLDELLDARSSGTARAAGPSARGRRDPALDRLIAEIGEAWADRTDYDQQQRLREAIDEVLAARMRAILHHPCFQTVEARWRSLHQLVMRAETGEGLRIRLIDLAAEDLLAELSESGGDVRETLLYRLMVEGEIQTPGGTPFGMLLCDFTVEDREDHLRLLGALAALADLARAPLVAAAGSSLSDVSGDVVPEASETWTQMRALPGARRVGLCCPRVLLRLPYGPETEPVERFAFDEGVTAEQPRAYLWGSSAWVLAQAGLDAVAAPGSLADLPKFVEVSDLPLHVHQVAGEVRQTGPTERLLTEPQLERLMDQGLIPVAAFRGTDMARILSVRSIAGPSLLAG